MRRSLRVCLALSLPAFVALFAACRDERAGPRPPPKTPGATSAAAGTQERAAGDEPVPTYQVQRTGSAPRIDGLLDDPAWKHASAVRLVNSLDGRRPSLSTVVRLLWDDEALYVAFDNADPDVWGTLLGRDEPIYGEEVVEVFLDADADLQTYQELEVSPRNTVFDASFTGRRKGMDTSYDARMTSAVNVRGTLDDRSDRDEGWSAELRIPFARLRDLSRVPPRAGDRWRFNLYRLEHVAPGRIEGHAFSPPGVGDFHHLPRFGWLELVGTTTAP